MNTTDPAIATPAACIMIVEDDMMVAMLLEDQLAELGYRTLKAARVAKAVTLAASAAIDAAILDVNVAGEPVYPVAAALRARGIPFVFATGYGSGGLQAEYRDSPTLGKPYRQRELKRVLATTLAGRGGGP